MEISFYGNILAGTAPILIPAISRNSDLFFEKKLSDKINTFIINYFGALFGVIAYKTLALIDQSPSHHPYIAATGLAISVAGALFSKKLIEAKEGEALTMDQKIGAAHVLTVQVVTNAMLGTAALFYGQFTFGAGAVLCTAWNFRENLDEGLEF